MLKTMQYFDSTMTDAPVFDQSNYLAHLQWALCIEKEIKYDSILHQEVENEERIVTDLIFNNGHGMTEHTIYQFYDDQTIIQSRIKIINLTTIRINEDASNLAEGFKVKARDTGFIFDEENRTIIMSSGLKIYDENGIKLQLGSQSVALMNSAISSNEKAPKWKIYVSEDALVVLQEDLIGIRKGYSGFAWFNDLNSEKAYILELSTKSSSGITSRYVVDYMRQSISALSNQIMLIGGMVRSRYINEGKSSMKEFSLIPGYGLSNLCRIPRLLFSHIGIEEQHIPERFLYFDEQLGVSIKTGGYSSDNHLVFIIGGHDGFLIQEQLEDQE